MLFSDMGTFIVFIAQVVSIVMGVLILFKLAQLQSR